MVRLPVWKQVMRRGWGAGGGDGGSEKRTAERGIGGVPAVRFVKTEEGRSMIGERWKGEAVQG